jgi:carboxypeptidase C (cathepsin A)
MTKFTGFLATLIGVAFLGSLNLPALPAFAAEPKVEAGTLAAEDDTPNDIKTVQKTFSSVIAGKTMTYQVTAGLTPIFDEAGQKTGDIFSVAYLAETKDGNRRPVTFVFNGGPGASSVYLHLGAFGPKIVPPAGQKGLDDIPAPPYELADNADSPFELTDLIFIDPVGTGFSRAFSDGDEDKDKEKKKSKVVSPYDAEANAGFWSVDSDLKSLAEFVRVWLGANKRWGVPVFIAGESYGGFRAAGLPMYLKEVGVVPSGTIMISPVISYQDITPTRDNFTADVEIFPTYAAVAHFHRRLPPDLQALSLADLKLKAQTWAETDYRAALAKGNRIDPKESDRVAADFSSFTSLPVELIKARQLRPQMFDFVELFLRDRGLFISVYDGRFTALRSYNNANNDDPSFVRTGESFHTALMHFILDTVGLSTTRRYESLNESTEPAWNFVSGLPDATGFADTGELLSAEMRRLPFFKVFLAMGHYDLVTPSGSVLAAIDRLDVPADLLDKNLESHIYEGGHMMYLNPDAARELQTDLKKWLRGILVKP